MIKLKYQQSNLKKELLNQHSESIARPQRPDDVVGDQPITSVSIMRAQAAGLVSPRPNAGPADMAARHEAAASIREPEGVSALVTSGEEYQPDRRPYMREYNGRPQVKERHAAYNRERWRTDPAYREQHTARYRERYQQDPTFRVQEAERKRRWYQRRK